MSHVPAPIGGAATGERGSLLPLVALLVLAAGGLVVGLGRVGADAVARARASTAADAAALAGAAEGRGAAERVTAANGAELVAYTQEGADVQVTVSVGRARATARARRVAGAPYPPRRDSRAEHRGNDDTMLPRPPVASPHERALGCRLSPGTYPVHSESCRWKGPAQ